MEQGNRRGMFIECLLEKMYKVFRNIVLQIYDDLIMVMEI